MPKNILNKRVKKLLYYAEGFRGLIGDPAVLIDDFVNLPVLSSYEAQRESIGFILPSDGILSFFQKEKEAGRICGFIVDVEKRNKGRGDYFVVTLSPSGVFWSKEPGIVRLEKGDLISAKMSKSGAVEIRKAKLK